MPDVVVERRRTPVAGIEVGVITLNRPDRLNAIVPGMLESYADALTELDADPRVRGIIVTGAGRGFCSGADLSVLGEGPQALRGYLDGLGPANLPTMAFSLATPVVTAVNGPCAGIGMLLALCSDVRFASPTASFTSAFARLGLVAEYGIAWVLPRLIGLPAATEWLLSGRSVGAEEALRAGLVTSVTSDPVSAAFAWASSVATGSSPDSIRAMKAALLDAERQSLSDAVDASLEAMRRSFGGPDLAEAIQARRDGRAPHFSGSSTPGPAQGVGDGGTS